jgi:hypothetical protein
MERKSGHRAAHGSPSPRRRPTPRPARSAGTASGTITSAASSAIIWVREHLIPVAVASVLAVGLVVGIVVFGIGGSQPASSSSRVVGSKAASAQAATTVTRGSKWVTGSRSKQFTVVNADVARVMAAERSGSRSAAAKSAGVRLAADAAAALHGPMPPVAVAVYRAALQRLETAGSAAASGQFGKQAAHLLTAGEAGLMRVAAAADMPVPGKNPAIPEPNGQ